MRHFLFVNKAYKQCKGQACAHTLAQSTMLANHVLIDNIGMANIMVAMIVVVDMTVEIVVNPMVAIVGSMAKPLASPLASQSFSTCVCHMSIASMAITFTTTITSVIVMV